MSQAHCQMAQPSHSQHHCARWSEVHMEQLEHTNHIMRTTANIKQSKQYATGKQLTFTCVRIARRVGMSPPTRANIVISRRRVIHTCSKLTRISAVRTRVNLFTCSATGPHPGPAYARNLERIFSVSSRAVDLASRALGDQPRDD